MSKRWLALLTGFVAFSWAAAAFADGNLDADALERLLGKDAGNVAVKPLKNDDALRLTMNRDQIIRLNQDAASVIVNNPDHAEVLLDSPRLLIVMPRAPGATSFTVLNSAGDIVLRRDVIVTNTQPKYVRIRRMCTSGDMNCTPSAYYYCPDGCYEVTPVGGNPAGASGIPAPTGGTAATAAATAPGVAIGGNNGGAAGGGSAGGASSAAPDNGGALPGELPVGPDGEPATTPGQQP